MRITFITLFPELIHQALEYGVTGQALKKGLFELETINPRDFAQDVHKTVDDRPYGGGDGMVLLADPYQKALDSVTGEKALVLHTSPQGEVFSDALSRKLSKEQHIVWVCSRYSGLDERWIQKNVHKEVSVGDFVTSGGELPALAMSDSFLRHLPGVLGHEDSHIKESFAYGAPLEAPLFTRPREWQGRRVPPVLFSGDHQSIEKWRAETGLVQTFLKRSDWFDSRPEKWQELKESLESLGAEFEKTPDNWPFLPAPDQVLKALTNAPRKGKGEEK